MMFTSPYFKMALSICLFSFLMDIGYGQVIDSVKNKQKNSLGKPSTNPMQGFKNPFNPAAGDPVKALNPKVTVSTPKMQGGQDSIKFLTTKGSFGLNIEKYHFTKRQIEANWANYLNLSPRNTFEKISERTDDLGYTHINYQQLYNNVVVDGAIVILHIKGATPKSINGHIAAIQNLPTNAVIDTVAALEKAKQFTKVTDLLRTYPIVLLIAQIPSKHGFTQKLAYKVRIDASKPFTMCDVFVDAITGQVVNKISLITNTDTPATANTLYSGTQNITTDSYSGLFRLRDNARKIETYDATNASLGPIYTGYNDYYNGSVSWLGVPKLSTVTISAISQYWWYTTIADMSPDLYVKIVDGSGQVVYNGISTRSNNTFPPITFATPIYMNNPPYSVELWDYDALGGDDYGGSFSLSTNSGVNPWSVNGNSGQYEILGSSRNPALDVHWGMEKTYDFYKNVFSRNSYDGLGSKIQSFINPPELQFGNDRNNAFANSNNVMCFGLGDGDYMKNVVGLDIAGHEFSHMVVDNNGFSGLYYAGESGALNESFADIFGTCIEFYSKPATANWLIGEDVMVSSPNMRSMSNPYESDNPQPNTYEAGTNWAPPDCGIPDPYINDNCGVHINSGVQNFWFYLLCQGGTDINDLGDNYSVTGIGISQARQIAYKNLTTYIGGSNSTYQDSYTGSLLAAEELYGNPSPQYTAVRQAWYAVGIGNDPNNFCSGTLDLTATSGSFTDGSGAANYGDNSNCSWKIAPPGANRITLSFTSFATELNYDTVLVYDGPDDTYPLLLSAWGNTLPPTISTSAGVGAMFVKFKSDVSNTDLGWAANYTSTGIMPSCGGGSLLVSPSGSFTDGSGSANYGNNQSCYWLIAPPCATSVTLSLSQLNTESGFDGLVVFDGSNASAPVIGVFTGTTLPASVTATSGQMLVLFYSDYSNTRPGFSANYTSTGSGYCSGTTTINSADFGVISDGSSTNNYCNNQDCKWLIQPPQATSVTLNFTDFDVEAASSDGNSVYDAVEIYNGTTTAAPLLGRFTGNNIPPSITASSGSMLVRFFSDLSETKTGWSAYYTSTSPSYCNNNNLLTASSGSFTDGSGTDLYANNSSCSWLIQPPGATAIQLNFTAFDAEQDYDGVVVFDGVDSTAPVLAEFTGTTLPTQVTSTSGSMYVLFLTDESIRKNGFSANYNAINVAIYNPLPDSTKACGDSVVLNAGAGYSSYLWNTGATTSSIAATQSGKYKVTVVNASGQTTKDSGYVNIIKANILQNDTSICLGGSITLSIDSSAFGKISCDVGHLPTNIRNGLQAYFPFCGNAIDATGNGNNGVITGAISVVDRNNSATSAFNFNGTSNYITLPLNTGNLNGTGKFTFSCFIKPSVVAAGKMQTIFAHWDQTSALPIGDKIGFMIALKDGVIYSSFLNSYNVANNTNLLANQWYRITVIFDGSEVLQTNRYKLYINGVLVPNNTTCGSCNASIPTTIGTTSDHTMIGARLANGNVIDQFSGVIDDVVFWNRKLSESEIVQSFLQMQTVNWSTGDTTKSIRVTPNNITTYYATVSDGISSCSDSVKVTPAYLSSFNPLQDTTRVCGSVTTLNAGSGFATYAWNTAATSQSISPTTNGKYKVAVTNAAGCTATDSTYLSMVKANIVQNDTIICKGNSITLNIDSVFTSGLMCNKNLLPAVLQSGLVGYWPFCGNANDMSGNGNNGTVNGASLTTDRFGNANSAYSFNGVSNWISVPSSPLLNLNNGFTISCYYYQNSNQAGGYLISRERYSNGTSYALNSSSGLIGLAINNDPGGTTCGQLCNKGITCGNYYIGDWQHIVATWDRATLKLYINGVLQSSSSVVLGNGNSLLNSTMNLFFGKYMTSNTAYPYNYLNGKLDDILIYSRALPDSEVEQLTTLSPSVIWSTGDTSSSITVSPNTNTTYYVSVSDGITSCMDSVKVMVSEISSFNPLQDTTRVCGSVTTLNAGSGFATYAWNTAATSQAITPTTNGKYKVAVINAAGCTANDSTYLSMVKANILQNDTTICKGNAITLNIDSVFTSGLMCNKNLLPASLQSGLVGYYPFCGNANDASGIGNNGIVSGPVLSKSRFNVNSDAYYFNSNSISFANSGVFNFTKNDNNSFSFWMKTSSKRLQWFYSKRINNSYNGFEIIMSNDTVLVFYGDNTNNYVWYYSSYSDISDNKWHHVVVTVDHTTKLIKTYVDGVYQNMPINISSITGEVATSAIAGIGGVVGSYYPDVFYDDVFVYNRVLNQNEVSQLYNRAPSVIWSTGDTSSSITVSPNINTTYYVTVSDGITSCMDSVKVMVREISSFDPLQDTTRVCGSVTTLNAGSGFASYTWNSAATSQSITPTTNGKYKVAVTNAAGCTATDSTYLCMVKANILQNDTSICKGNSITLNIDSVFTSGLMCNKNLLPSSLQSGLVGYYPFCGNANDASGNGNNGVVFGPVLSKSRFNVNSDAYYFNNNRISFANSGVFNFTKNDNSSFSFWMKTSTRQEQRFFSKRINNTYNGFEIVIVNDTILVFYGDNTNQYLFSHCTHADITDNKWHHVVMTVDHSAKLIKTYVDGVYQNMPVDLSSVTGEVATSAIAGIGTIMGSSFPDVFYDDVFVYNRALNQNEVSQLYNRAPSVMWSTGDTSTSITVTPNTNTTYYVSVSDGITSCTDSVKVNVTYVDTTLTVLDALQQCSNNGQVRMQAALSASYKWLKNGVAIAGAVSQNYTATQTGVYRVVLTNITGCRDSSRSVSVSINPVPVASFAVNSNAQCLTANNFVFTNSSTISAGSITYQWHFGDGTNSSTTNPSHTYAAAGTYQVTLVTSSSFGCADSSSQTLTVNPKPAVSFTVNSNAQCVNGNGFVFTNTTTIGSGSMSYQWSFGDGATSSGSNASNSYLLPGTYTVKLIATSAFGCRDSASMLVTVYDKPTVSFTTNNAAQCLTGNNFVFTNSSTIGTGTLSYGWYFGDGLSANTTNSTHSYTVAGTYSVKLVATSNNGCTDSSIFSVTVHAQPPVPLIAASGPLQFCVGDSVTLSTTAAANWQWYNNGLAIAGATANRLKVTQSGLYTVSSTNANGCMSNAAALTVTVYALPTGTLNTPPQNYICEGTPVVLSATGAFLYQWYFNGMPIAGATDSTYNATLAGQYTVAFVSAQGCVKMSGTVIILTLIKKPDASFTYNNYCINIPILFGNTSVVSQSGQVNYMWMFGDGNSATSSSAVHVYTQPANYMVLLSVTPQLCQQLTDTAMKLVRVEAPAPGISYDAINALVNVADTLEARPFGNSYLWSPTTGLNNAAIAAPILTPTREQLYLVRIINPAGCTTIDSQMVRIFNQYNIYVPEAFSPDGDGQNDLLYPFLVGIRQLLYLKVYNRWGNLVFETNSADKMRGWNGMYKGKMQPSETYVWIAAGVAVDGKTVKRGGNVILVR